MNIVFPAQETEAHLPLKKAFETMGHNCIPYGSVPHNPRIDPRFRSVFFKFLQEADPHAVFTSGYYPVISACCNAQQIPYLSYIMESPQPMTLSRTVLNPCNYLFVFDSLMAQELQSLGAEHVYYLPLAVDAEQFDEKDTPSGFQTDVSFVGSLYTAPDRFTESVPLLKESTRGYLDGILQAQQLIYGYSFLENILIPNVLNDLIEKIPVRLQPDSFETYEYIYTQCFLNRLLTRNERLQLLKNISAYFQKEEKPAGHRQFIIHTPESSSFLPDIKNAGPATELSSQKEIYRSSKINLNITPRTIRCGIPQDTLNIMAAGGFVLSNYQNDLTLHFTANEDYVYFENTDDLTEKLTWYLTHEEERQKIAAHAQHKVLQEHTWQKRAEEILTCCNL